MALNPIHTKLKALTLTQTPAIVAKSHGHSKKHRTNKCMWRKSNVQQPKFYLSVTKEMPRTKC